MIEVRQDKDDSARLMLVVVPPEKHDVGVDPVLATQRLFSILAGGQGRRADPDQSTQSSPESR